MAAWIHTCRNFAKHCFLVQFIYKDVKLCMQNEIQDAGGIRPLVDLLKPINPADKKILNNDIKNAMEIAQEMAAGAIANLTHHGITLTQQGACEVSP